MSANPDIGVIVPLNTILITFSTDILDIYIIALHSCGPQFHPLDQSSRRRGLWIPGTSGGLHFYHDVTCHTGKHDSDVIWGQQSDLLKCK